MIQELLDSIDTLDFEEQGAICLLRAQWSHRSHRSHRSQKNRDNLELTVEVFSGGDEASQKWIFLCQSVRKHQIVLNSFYDIELSHEHILLWPHTLPRSSLWFHGRSQNVPALVGDLYQAHHQMVADWFDFPRFFNASSYSRSLFELLKGGYGKLAEGPEPIIAAYQNVLQKHDIESSVTLKPAWHYHGKAENEPDELVVLLLGDSRVIASSVTAQRIE